MGFELLVHLEYILETDISHGVSVPKDAHYREEDEQEIKGIEKEKIDKDNSRYDLEDGSPYPVHQAAPT